MDKTMQDIFKAHFKDLANEILENLGAPFSGQNFIEHLYTLKIRHLCVRYNPNLAKNAQSTLNFPKLKAAR